MLVWPTSEFPICPSGSPTARPELSSSVRGIFPAKRSRFGVPARRMALSSRSERTPQPSRTARRTRCLGGMGRSSYPAATVTSTITARRDTARPRGRRRLAPTRRAGSGWIPVVELDLVPSSSQPSTQARVRAFDWLRGLAVLVMIETHAQVLLRKELLATRTAGVLDYVNGLVAPSFIFAAGFSLALVQVRTASASGPRAPRLLRSLRRIGEVLAVGTLINWIWFPISVQPGWLLRIDILQCIGLTLLAALPLNVALASRTRTLCIASAAIALALF